MDFVLRGWNAIAGAVTARDVVMLLLRLTLIGALGHLGLALLARASAAARHLVAVATLAVLAATPWVGPLGALVPALRVPVPVRETDTRGAAILRSLELASLPAPVAKARSLEAARDFGRIEPASATPAAGPAEPATLATEPEAAAPAWRPARAANAWPAALAALAVLGAMLLLLSRAVALLATLWVARRARPIDAPRIHRAFAAAAGLLGVRRPVELLVTSDLAVPAVVAFPRPRLLLPEAALEWDDARLHPVFVHELAHVQRCDGFGFAIARLATALVWFHPLAWTLGRAARQECERACDDVVLAAGVRASDYADQLLTIARSAGAAERNASMSLAFARPSSLEGRLLSILRAGTRRTPVTRRMALGASAALALLLLPLATVRVVAAPQGKDSCSERTRTSTSTRTRTATVTRAGWESGESASSCADAGKLACESEDAAIDAETADLGPAEARSGEEWYTVAKSQFDAERWAMAGEAYERAAEAGYESGKAWYNAACSWSRGGERNRAVGALRQSIDQGFADPDRIAGDDDFDAVRSDRRFQMLANAAKHGHTKWKDEDEEDSRDEDRIEADSDDPSELKSTAMRLMRTGEPERAARLFLRQYAADSTASALYNTACAYAIAHDSDRAFAALKASIYAGYGDADKLTSDDDLRSLRGSQRFRDLVGLVSDLEMDYPGFKWNRDEESEWQKMLPRLQRIARQYPDAGRAWWNLGLAELRAGDPEASREAYLRALSFGYRRGNVQYNLACAAAQAGDEDEAFRRLDMAEEAGMDIASIAGSDDDLKPLHDDPRFDRLMSRIDAAKARKHGKAAKDRWKDKS